MASQLQNIKLCNRGQIFRKTIHVFYKFCIPRHLSNSILIQYILLQIGVFSLYYSINYYLVKVEFLDSILFSSSIFFQLIISIVLVISILLVKEKQNKIVKDSQQIVRSVNGI